MEWIALLVFGVLIADTGAVKDPDKWLRDLDKI